MKKKYKLLRSPIHLSLLLTLLTAIIPNSLWAIDEGKDLKPEMGFWVGASNPVPYSKTDEILDSTIGGGLFYRVKWPWVFHTEMGLSFAHYDSRMTQSVTVIPVYAALSYRLPLSFQIQTFLKLGGGGSFLEVRPKNKHGWDPLLFSGIEFSIRAGRRVRIGLRLDYNLVYEKHLDPPPEIELLKYYGSTDPRYKTNSEFRLRNGNFFHFGLMFSFYM